MKGCTVAELIEHLKTMPQDAHVVFDRFSDTEGLEIEDVNLVRAEDEKLAYREEQGYVIYRPHQWTKETRPEFVTVVNFPGN